MLPTNKQDSGVRHLPSSGVRPLPVLTLAACLFALVVIGLGAFTRLVDAGLGCPDWPGCYGHLIVPITNKAQQLVNIHYPETPLIAYKAWAEMAHRYVVGCLSILIIAIVTMIFLKREYRRPSNILLAIFLILLVVYQILLGRWTVTLKLLPAIVTQHLLGGFLILSTLWVIYLINARRNLAAQVTEKKQILLPFAFIALILLLLQILLGAWTSTNYASFSCPDFPFCQNKQVALPMHYKDAFNVFSPVGVNYEGGVLSNEARQTIQMTHRLGALILTLYLLFFISFAFSRLKNSSQVLPTLYLILGLLVIQLSLGIANVILKLPLLSAIGHNLVAVLLLLAIITLIFKLASVRYEFARARK